MKHEFVKCPDCEGKGYISIQMEMEGREVGIFTCPFCAGSPKPGYIIKRIEEVNTLH